MFTKGNIVFSDSGKYIKGSNFIGFKADGATTDFQEIDLGTPTIKDNNIIFGDMITPLPDIISYESLKVKFINWHYTNDDQMALLLNNGTSDDNTNLYNKMQEWRKWSGDTATTILNLINNVASTK